MFKNSTFSPIIMNVSPGPGQYYVFKSGSWIIREADMGTVLVVEGKEWYYDPGTEKWYDNDMFDEPGYDYPPGAPQP